MANLGFFASRDDQKAVADFLFAHTDVRVFESYSEFGQELREFKSFSDLSSAFEVGVDRHGNGTAILLQLWSPSVMAKPEFARIDLDPRRCDGHTFRFCVRGGGLVQLYFGGVHDWVITASTFGHFSEAGARAKGQAAGVNWTALGKLSNKIQYHVRRRLAVARVPGRPVLPQAYELAKSGYALKEAAKARWQYELPPSGKIEE